MQGTGKWMGMAGLVVLAAIGGKPGAASAITLSDVTATWTQVTLDNGNTLTSDGQTVTGIGTNEIRWGNPATWRGQSGLRFEGVTPPAQSFALEEEFEIGELTHFNNPVYAPTAVDALLDLMMVFSDPAGLDGNFSFSFGIDETPNISGDGIPDDDIILFPNTYSNEVVTIAGVDFTLQLLGFRSDDDEVVTQFISKEKKTSSAILIGKLTADFPTDEDDPNDDPQTGEMPEPASAMLGLLSLAGLTLSTGRRR